MNVGFRRKTAKREVADANCVPQSWNLAVHQEGQSVRNITLVQTESSATILQTSASVSPVGSRQICGLPDALAIARSRMAARLKTAGTSQGRPRPRYSLQARVWQPVEPLRPGDDATPSGQAPPVADSGSHPQA